MATIGTSGGLLGTVNFGGGGGGAFGGASMGGQGGGSDMWERALGLGRYNLQRDQSRYLTGGQSAADAQALARIPVDAQMSRFNTIRGDLQNQLGNVQGAFANADNTARPAPDISVGGVLNPQQVQQQVNQARAGNDQATQAKITASNQSMAGRGFGSNSPLAMALGQGYQNQGLATNTENETNTRLGARQLNAGHVLNTQQARSNQWAQGEEFGIKRRAPIWGMQNALISALGGIA